MTTERATVSVMKACEIVDVSRRTLYNWMQAGRVQYKRTAGGSRRIYVDSLWRDDHDAETVDAPLRAPLHQASAR